MGRRVARAQDSLMDALASPALSAASAASSSFSSPYPQPFHSILLTSSPPPSPPSPAPSLSLLGKLALSSYIQPHSPQYVDSPLSPLLSDSRSPLPARPHFASTSPPPVPLLFSRPTSGRPLTPLSPPPTSRSHRSPPRVPSFSPPLTPVTVHAVHHAPSQSQRHRTHEPAQSVHAPPQRPYETRDAEDEWRVSSEADVRRMLDELRDELQHVAHKLAAVKRCTARLQAQRQTAGGWQREGEEGAAPPLSPRTRHIVRLLEEADELLQHNKPAQPASYTSGTASRAGEQWADERWKEQASRRPQTAPVRYAASGFSSNSGSASFVNSAASNHLLRAYDELLDRFRSQVLRIDATLAAVD